MILEAFAVSGFLTFKDFIKISFVGLHVKYHRIGSGFIGKEKPDGR
jgi:hypothetical protein